MASLTSSLIIKLINQVTAPAKQVVTSVNSIGKAFSGLGGKGMTAKLDAAIKQNNQALEQMRGRLVDAVAGFYLLKSAIGDPIRAARELDSQLTQLGLKVGSTFDRNEVRDRLRKLSRDTTQSMSSLTNGIDMLVSKGAELGTALDLAPVIGKATSAYKGNMADLASAGYAAVDNLKIPASEAARLFDILAQSGKDGAFEINNMAREFPTLAAQYKGLEQTGLKAAANLATSLQVAMKGAGSPEEAATNVKNLLQQIYAPRTVKNFSKMGINLRREMTLALKKGMSPEMAIADITNRALKGDLSKMGQLFMNAQAQQALRPLIQNRELWEELNKKAYAARDKKGIDQDYRDWLQTPEGAITRLTVALGGLKENIGSALLAPLRDIAMSLAPIVERISDFAAANPKLISTLVGATAALIGFRIAAIAVRYASLQAKGGVLELAAGMLRIGRMFGFTGNAAARQAKALVKQRQASYKAALQMQKLARQGKVSGVSFGQATAHVRKHGMALAAAQQAAAQAGVRSTTTFGAMGRGIGNLLNPLRLGKAAFRGIVGALRGLKWLAGGSLFGMAAFAGLEWLTKNWKGLVEFCTSFGTSFMNALGPAKPVVEAIGSAFSGIYDWISKLLGPIDETGAKWRGWGEAAGAAVGGVIKLVADLIGKLASAIQSLGQLLSTGQMKVDWGKGFKTNADRGSPGFGAGGGMAAPDYRERASGGPVSAGQPYLVGEEGPELIVPRGSGHVHTAGETRKMLGGGSGRMAGGGITFNLGTIAVSGVTDPRAVADLVIAELQHRIGSALTGIQADLGYTS